MDQLALDLLQPLQPRLDNFVAGRNAEAVAALQALVAGRSAERSIYLWGSRGCGRTHLVRSLLAIGGWGWTAEADPERPGLAVLDGVEGLDVPGQVALFNRLNAVRSSPRCASVTTGDAAPARLGLREDLRTRLGWGLVYQLQPLSDDEKLAALQAHIAARGVQVAEGLLPYLLSHLPRDLRTLTAALDALDAFALAHQRALTVPLLKDWLAHTDGAPPP
jgi:DnaA family protein